MLSATITVRARLLLAFLMVSCQPQAQFASGPLTQRGYLWQRTWTASVERAFAEAEEHFDGVILLGGEIGWSTNAPRLIKASVRWDVVAEAKKKVTLALRLAPFGGPFDRGDANAQFIASTVKSLLAEAAARQVNVAEFQLDFDCPQKKLAGYREWLTTVRAAVDRTPLSITALPAWLDEPEFASLVGEVDDYVLQVHSVPAHAEDNRAVLCDPRLAHAAVEKAARLGRRFSVALPTYRCLAGYDNAGKLLSVGMDSVQPVWPGGTRVLEFASDPDQLAALVREWKERRPAAMQGLVWYRVPTDADVRNWRWPTLNAVMQGRAPKHQLNIASKGENPVDLELINSGEAEERFAGSVLATWRGPSLVASDAVAGWRVRSTPESAIFTPETGQSFRLLPGERRGIGWLRYDRPAQPQLVLAGPESSR